MPLHPPDPLVVHPLPAAPSFVGRGTELQELNDYWNSGFRGVVALVGLGGAGKTAVAARFIDELIQPTRQFRPRGLLVWSFYDDPDPGHFLRQADQYFARQNPDVSGARGVGLLHSLQNALTEGALPHLLVLDGLERVQRQESTSEGPYGQIEDPLLKAFVVRIAEGTGATVLLTTSRFPLTDLARLPESNYRHLDIGGLDDAAARDLLRQRGVQGDDAGLVRLVETYGAHALTLDHLGSLIAQFLDGDPNRAPEVSSIATPGHDRQAFRLARILLAYENHLPAAELALLTRLCLLRTAIREEQVRELFLCVPSLQPHGIREIQGRIERLWGEESYSLVDDVGRILQEALVAAPIAGPLETLQLEIIAAAEKFMKACQGKGEKLEDDLIRLYANSTALLASDREALARCCDRLIGLREKWISSFKGSDQLKKAFKATGLEVPAKVREDMQPVDIIAGIKRAQKRLHKLVAKHFALRRVRELTDTYQRKYSLAGPLATLEAKSLMEVLNALVARHLVLRQSDGSFTVHPAVRDYFGRLAPASEQQAFHNTLRVQLLSLVQRPGRNLPDDFATLNLAEEAIYHALQAGRPAQARQVYNEVLGGLRHLGWKLGEMSRGLRILRQFDPCPDAAALGWFLRALGELDEAYTRNPLPYFRADIRLLQGRLPAVAAEGDSTRTAVADFLMGKTRSVPPQPISCVVPRDQCLLYLGRIFQVHHSVLLEAFYHDIGWEGDRVRCQLILVEIARRQNQLAMCNKCLESASGWTLHSGSVEHLCLLYLMQARVDRSAGSFAQAETAIHEALHLAREHGLGLYHIEALCEQGAILLALGKPLEAEPFAREALRRASSVDCQFLWAVAEAGHLLGDILANSRRHWEARSLLEKTLALRQRLDDPKAVDTQRLMDSLMHK